MGRNILIPAHLFPEDFAAQSPANMKFAKAIKAYYERDGISMILGDWEEVLPLIVDHSIHMVLSDVPFGINWENRNHERILEDDGTFKLRKSLDEVLRVLCPLRRACIFAAFQSFKYFEDLPVPKVKPVIWHKMMHGASRGLWLPCWEMFFTFINAPKKHIDISDRHLRDLLSFKKIRGKKLHQNEKPLDLCSCLINACTDPGETVLDYCAGSASVLVAAFLNGRKAIGIEKDRKHYETSVARLESTIDSASSQKQEFDRNIEKIVEEIMQLPNGTKFTILASILGDTETLNNAKKAGYNFLLIKKNITINLEYDDNLEKYPVELIVDKLIKQPDIGQRLKKSVSSALSYGGGRFSIKFEDRSTKTFSIHESQNVHQA